MSTATKRAPAPIDLSGLDAFNVSSLMQAGVPEAKAESNGKPLEIPLDEILEDPDQPRTADNPGFSHESLSELAESIEESDGVKTPISVRSKNADGFYVINHGARRFRASKLAKRKTIKAFIDDQHDEYDQAIENIQRENFTPMEIAMFIEKREKKGDSRVSIAKRLGKSKAFVTQHAALLTLPPALRELYDEGRCRDVLALYELANLHKKHPAEVLKFIESVPEITRSAVEALKASLKAAAKAAEEGDDAGEDDGAGDGDGGGEADPQEKSGKAKKSSVMVKHGDSLFLLRADIRPSALRLGWIEDPATGATTEVELSELSIDSIVES
jgi:ParB family chromosome partitioning protein